MPPATFKRSLQSEQLFFEQSGLKMEREHQEVGIAELVFFITSLRDFFFFTVLSSAVDNIAAFEYMEILFTHLRTGLV